MTAETVADNDPVYRHVIDPNAFNAQGFAPQKWLKLADTGTGAIGSVAWSRLLPTIADVHGYGIRLAAFMNDNLRSKGKFTEKKARLYCGAYELPARAVRSLVGTPFLEAVAAADVIPHDEIGEPAHCDLAITSVSGGNFLEETKTEIIDRLWHACSAVHKYDSNTLAAASNDTMRYSGELPDPPAALIAKA